MSVNEEYPTFPPPRSLRSVTVTAFTKTWCWSGSRNLTAWLEKPSQWAGLEVLRIQMTPMQNFGCSSLAAVKESEPWAKLGHCLRDRYRFPSLQRLEVVLIMEGGSLFDWQEFRENCDECVEGQMAEAKEAIEDGLDIQTDLAVMVGVSLTPF